MTPTKFALALGLVLTVASPVMAAAPLWTDIGAGALPTTGLRLTMPSKARYFRLEPAALNAVLARAPAETGQGARPTLQLPMPDGTTLEFTLVQSQVMEPELAARYPMIRTFVGTATADPTITGRFQSDPRGFRGMVFTPKGTAYIDPVIRGDATVYQAYYGQDLPLRRRPGDSLYHPSVLAGRAAAAVASAGTLTTASTNASAVAAAATGAKGIAIANELRTYRVAMASTYEYSKFHDPNTVPFPDKKIVLAEIVNVINRVTGVYERELGIRLVLIDGNDKAIYNTPAQPYTDQAGPGMVEINTAVLDMNVGNANYDIGHVASTGGGGIAGLGVVCDNDQKGAGVTGLGTPVGDAYYIDFVAHEMGHQFGGNHTFNGDETANCGPNRNDDTSFEPGSGVTIMGYAGVCSDQDIAPHSIDVFHAASFDEITAYSRTGTGNSCPKKTTIANRPPVAVVPARSYAIPKGTSFALTAGGSDPDGDPVSYQWEEYDLGTGGEPNAAAATANQPLFRNFLPTTNPVRTFPQLSDIVSNTQTYGEILPTVARSLKFRLTVRDYKQFPSSGGVNSADYSMTVASSGPFKLTAPNTATSYQGGDKPTVTWAVAGTTAAPVSCATVDLLLSADGGTTFPYTLATATPNDGSEAVTLPNLATGTARLKVQCSDNIFFDISDANLAINQAAPVLKIDSGYENPDTNGAYALSWTRPASAVGPDLLQESGSCAPLVTDDAESGLAKWDTATSGAGAFAWQTSTMKKSSGANSFWGRVAEGAMNVNTTLTLKTAVKLPTDTDATLSFFESALNEGDDTTVVEITKDNGATWEKIAENVRSVGATSGPDYVAAVNEPLSKSTYSLAAYRGQTVKLRFRMQAGGEDRAGSTPLGWYIDDISLTGVAFKDLATVTGTSFALAGHDTGAFCYRVQTRYPVIAGPALSPFSNLVNVTVASTNRLPVARLVASATSGKAPLAVEFDGSGSADTDGDALKAYRFDFGDGSPVVTQADPKVSHTYRQAGNFAAKLMVTDAREGASASPAIQTITVAPAQQDPTPFSFQERREVTVNAFVTSESVTLAGFTGTLPITIDNGGQYSIDGAAFTSEPGTIAAGSKLIVRHVSAATNSTTKTSTVKVGDYATAFRTTTVAKTADRTPDAFDFGSQTGLEPGVTATSAARTLTGFDSDAPIVAGPGAKYSIDGGAFTSTGGTLKPGQALRVQHAASTSKLGYTKTYVKVGGVTGYFTTRTK